ncbi:MAG: GEVED domain-containing protein, partial [Bacteroidota bacterium]
MTSKKPFAAIVEQADAYFAAKYPNRTAFELTQGEHRDGEFVKYMRWKYYWKSHLNPNGTLGDPSAYFREGRINPRTTGLYCDVPWNNISIPENLGGQIGVGRTTSVAFHPEDPETFWVSTAIGGIWKTTNGGNSYIPIAEDLPILAVSVVAVDYSNPDIIYAATGDRVWYGLPSIGIYKSTDGGLNWTETSLTINASSQFRVYAMTIDPDDPTKVYVAADNGLFRTTDRFETVELVNSFKFYDVKFHPTDPSIMYATSGSFFWKSTDGGETFFQKQVVQSSTAIRLVVSPAAPDRVYYSAGSKLYQSYDQGESFPETKDIGDLDNGDFGYVFMSHENPDLLYGGYFNTWKSTNNGSNWSRITCFTGGDEIHVDNHFAAINPLVSDEVYFCNDGGLYKFPENSCSSCSSCFGEYIDLSKGMKISQYYDISNSQQQKAIIAGGTQDNGSFFRNAEEEWQFYASTGDGMVGAIDPINDDFRYWEYQFGSISRYVNGNNTCISCNIPNDEHGNGAWVTPYQLDPNNPEVIIAAYSRVYRSTNRGASWTTISDELAGGSILDLLTVAPSNSDVVYTINFNQLYRTSNASAGANANWESMTMPSGGITQITVDPADENRIYITRGGYNAGNKVYISENGGQTWTNISGSLPNVPANTIKAINDPNYDQAVFVGTDAGVYYLDANLEDWEEYGKLPHTQVRDIEFQYEQQLIRIGTHGRSVFEAPLPLSNCLSDNPDDEDNDGVCDALDVCPDGDDTIDVDLDGQPDACETYCFAEGSPGTGSDWINRVAVHTLDNTSAQTAYSDFTAQGTELERGEIYPIQIGLNFAFDQDAAYAWIDFNHNTEFDTNEAIPMSNFDEQYISYGEVIVPEDALLGETILRVRNTYLNNQISDPCSNYFGEVEDYTITIVESTTSVQEAEKG